MVNDVDSESAVTMEGQEELQPVHDVSGLRASEPRVRTRAEHKKRLAASEKLSPADELLHPDVDPGSRSGEQDVKMTHTLPSVHFGAPTEEQGGFPPPRRPGVRTARIKQTARRVQSTPNR